MAGRFEGLKDAEWELFEDIFPKKDRRGRGMPASCPRKILNSLLWLLITGCRWCDFPREPQWASKSASHRWLKTWHLDGTLGDVKARLLGIAQIHGLIHWSSGAVDGSFFPGKGDYAEVAYGYKGKGVLIHLLVDASWDELSACCCPIK